jgi:hypothetical protein
VTFAGPNEADESHARVNSSLVQTRKNKNFLMWHSKQG